MTTMKTGIPAQKVTAAAAAAAFSTVLVNVLGETIPGMERFSAELVTVVTFLVGYFVPPSKNDAVEG